MESFAAVNKEAIEGLAGLNPWAVRGGIRSIITAEFGQPPSPPQNPPT